MKEGDGCLWELTKATCCTMPPGFEWSNDVIADASGFGAYAGQTNCADGYFVAGFTITVNKENLEDVDAVICRKARNLGFWKSTQTLDVLTNIRAGTPASCPEGSYISGFEFAPYSKCNKWNPEANCNAFDVW